MVKTFTRDDLRDYSEKILRVIRENEINSRENLENKAGDYSISDTEKIVIEMRPSNKRTDAHVISYISKGDGIPIELRINYQLNYLMIILKSSINLRGYAPFAYDESVKNIIQSKIINNGLLPEALRELEELAK